MFSEANIPVILFEDLVALFWRLHLHSLIYFFIHISAHCFVYVSPNSDNVLEIKILLTKIF